MEEYSNALGCLSTFFASEDPNIVIWAFQGGFFPNILEIINTGLGQDKKHALFALSNIAAGSDKEPIRALLDETLLMERVIELMNHTEVTLMGEASWVIANAINCADKRTLVQFTSFMEGDLINALVMKLRDLP